MPEIRFDEENHIYTYKNQPLISVTTLIKKYTPCFDSLKVAKKVCSLKTSAYYGKEIEEVLKTWKDKGTKASSLGTKLHNEIERYYKHNRFPEIPSQEFEQFLQFNQKEVTTLGRPFKSEWVLFSEDAKLAGTVDMTFIDQNGSISIVDWKRCKKIHMDNDFQSMLPPFERFPSSNFWKYSFQLNLYRYLIEQNGYSVKDLKLVVFHESRDEYQVYEVPILLGVVNTILTEKRRN